MCQCWSYTRGPAASSDLHPQRPLVPAGRAEAADRAVRGVTGSGAGWGWRWWEQALFHSGQMDAFSGFSNCITMGCVLRLCRGGL